MRGNKVEITAEELATWLEPRVAVERVAKAVGSKPAAANALLECLKAGMIRSAADAASTDETPVLREPVLIRRHAWERAKSVSSTGDFWQTGMLKVVPDRHDDRWIMYFRVRFDPAGIDEMCGPLESPQVAARSAPDAGALTAPETDRSGLPPVTVSLLDDWARVFVKAYPTATEDLARKSALGMFPDKAVPRQRLRDALKKAGATQPRGRRPGPGGE
jgi:hypothetical protein